MANFLRNMLVGTAVGLPVGAGINFAARDNYTSEAGMRNMVTGGITGGLIGGSLGAGLLGATIRRIPGILSRVAGTSILGGTNLAIGVARAGHFMMNHPGMVMAGAGIAGASYLAYTGSKQTSSLGPNTMVSQSNIGNSSYARLQNSSTGLTFSLHNRRHR